MCDYRTKWTLVRELPGKYKLVHIARLNNESSIIPLNKHDKYVLKQLDSCNRNPIYVQLNIDTIRLNIKLSLMGLLPGILDYNDNPDKIMYFVTKLYMLDGADYIVMLNQLYDNFCYDSTQPGIRKLGINKIQLTKLYKAYITRMIVLYNRLAMLGVCTFDTKNENIVVNYNHRYEITDMRLIDINSDRIMVVKNPSELNMQVFYTAMLLMNFAVASLYTFYNKERLLRYYRIAFNTSIIGIYSLHIDEIQSREILNEFKKLIPHTTEHKITWCSMLWCYWHNHIDIDTFTVCSDVEQEFMIERILSEIFEPHTIYSPKPHALYSLRGASHPRNATRSSSVVRAAV